MSKMRRKMRGKGRSERSRSRPAVTGEYSATPLATATQIVALPNTARYFRIQSDVDPSTLYGPQYFMMGVNPLAAFLQGYDQTDPKGSGLCRLGDSYGDATLTGVPVDRNLYPTTPYAILFDENIYPLIETLTQQGLGARFDKFGRPQLIRYFVMVAMCYMFAYTAVQINRTAYTFKWSSIPPGSSEIPPSIWKLVDLFSARAIDLDRIWVPLMQRIETKILPPMFIAQIKRMLTPFLTWGASPKLIIPFPRYGRDPWDLTPTENHGDFKTTDWPYKVQDWLEYIDEHLQELANLVKNFLPFPVLGADPWAPGSPIVDSTRSMAMLNSARRTFDFYNTNGQSFSDTDWPGSFEGPRFFRGTTGTYSNIHIFSSSHTVWDMVQFMGVYLVDQRHPVTNGYWSRLFTPHRTTSVMAFGDDWQGNGDTTNVLDVRGYEDFWDVGSRYYPSFFPIAGRYLAAWAYDIGQGWNMPNTLSSTMPFETADMMLRRQVETDFNYPTLIELQMMALGGALRERRRGVDEEARKAFSESAG